MIIADIAKIAGRTYPARRWTRGMVGQAGQAIPAKGFAMGYVVLEPKGGQVPWHNQEQEEVYMVLEGRGEICVGAERQEISAGQAVFLPPTVFHQLTNTGDEPLHMMYIYCPGGDVAHWRQELDGTPASGRCGCRPRLCRREQRRSAPRNRTERADAVARSTLLAPPGAGREAGFSPEPAGEVVGVVESGLHGGLADGVQVPQRALRVLQSAADPAFLSGPGRGRVSNVGTARREHIPTPGQPSRAKPIPAGGCARAQTGEVFAAVPGAGVRCGSSNRATTAMMAG
jgi:mannose-6-phosphate isomerase-like protein (cupin superfamily)